MNHYIGLDIGGTKIYGAVYDEDWNVIKDLKVPTQASEGFEIVYKNIVHVINEIKTDQTQSIGLAWPGFVTKDGFIQKTPNISTVEDVWLAKDIEKEIGIPTTICNDAKLFAFAEYGAQNPSPKATLGIIFGTGVGSGFVCDGDLLMGANGFATEIGQVLLVDTNKTANTLFAGRGIHAFFAEQGWEDDVHVIQDAMRADKDQFKSMLPFIDSLCGWLRDVILAFDPDDIVFGGSVGIHFWSIWKEEIEASLAQKLAEYPNTISLRFSELDNAGSLGAGMFGKQATNLK